MHRARIARVGGFTLIEAMVAVAIATILLVVAVPGFGALFAKKRVEGATAELGSDLQFARSEAVRRNANVRLTFGSGCYAVHLATSGSASCTQAGALKSFDVATNSSVQFSAAAGDFIEFEPVRGSASGAASSVTVTTSTGPWHMGVCLNAVGRVRLFSAGGSGQISGVPADCPT